ncbi:MAG: hypothetical protein QF673_01220 [Candidatus Hydrothermarchaeota archaeon]|nr:hypothetical protein [Candidatus Hydrothermarchaeota archaeon]
MKWILLAIVTLAMVSPANGVGGEGVVILENLSLPKNVYPGDNITIAFSALNSWHGDLRDGYVHLEGGAPFLKTSPTEPKKVREIEYWWVENKAVPLSFSLEVDKGAKAGSYTVNVVFTYTRYSDATGTKGGFARFKQVEPLTIEVRGRPELKVVVKSSEPRKIRAGDLVEIKISVVNLGSEEVRNVLLYAKPSPPVDLMWQSEVLYIDEIPPQGKGSAAITVDVSDKAKAGRYSLPLTLSYEDKDAKRFEIESAVSVTIEESADFEITPLRNEVESDARDKRVTFEVANTGSRDAEELKAILKASYPFTPTGNEYFVSLLKPGDNAELAFHADIDDDASTQRYPVDVILQWKEGGDDYSEKKTSYIDVTRAEGRERVYAASFLGLLFLILLMKKFLGRRKS